MKYSPEQRGVIRGSALAVGTAAALLVAGYLWFPPELVGVERGMDTAQRIAFALKADVFVLLWLAGCVKAVSGGRFRSPADIRGSAFGAPSPAIAVRVAVLQNSLEQTVLAVGAHLALATVLRDYELVLIPLLVFLYLLGRAAFAVGYAKGASSRAFGMALTGVSIVAAYALTIGLTIVGR